MYLLKYMFFLFSYKDLVDDETQEFPSTAGADDVLRDVTNHDSNAPSVSGSDVENPLVITVEGSEDRPIPQNFPFPAHYTADIELALKVKQVQSRQIAKLVTRIAHVMFDYKRYPTRKEYERVAKQLVDKYPFLASPFDRDVS